MPSDRPEVEYDRSWILNFSLIVYGVLLLISTAWCEIAKINLLSAFITQGKTDTIRVILIGGGAGLAIAAIGLFLLWLSKVTNIRILQFEPFHKILYDELAPMFRQSTWVDLVAIACVSGFCEEVLFRGVVQSQWGLIWASAIFGVMHCPTLRYVPYGLWAMFAGLVFGYLRDYSGSMWVPIIAHVLNNTIGLFYLRRWVVKQPVTAKPHEEDL